jgi:translocator protein
MLLGFVGLCLLVAAADAAVTEPGMRNWYPHLRHPPGTPPNWAFPVVWIPLYVMIAVAAWRIWRAGARATLSFRPDAVPLLRICRRGLRLWGLQLLVNALWTPVFFGLHRPWAALAVMLALIGVLCLVLRDFGRIDRVATVLMAPVLLWVLFACWLNAGVAWLNRV